MEHIYLWILELVPEGAEKPLEGVAGKHHCHTVLGFTVSFITFNVFIGNSTSNINRMNK